MTLYICLSEEGARAVHAQGFDAKRGDLLVLAHDAVYSMEAGSHVRFCRDDLVARGLPATDQPLDDAALMQLVLEHDRIVVV